MNTQTSTTKNPLKWLAWFWLGNVFLLWLVAYNYLPSSFFAIFSELNSSGKILFYSYLILTYTGYFALLASLPHLLSLPLINFRKAFVAANICGATLLIIFIALDTRVYSLYHFHLNSVVIHLIFANLKEKVFGFTFIEYVIAITFVLALVIIEIAYASYLHKQIHRLRNRYFYTLVIACSLSLYLSFFIVISSIKYITGEILLTQARIFPFYYQTIGNLFSGLGTQQIDRLSELHLYQPEMHNQKLHYPLVANLKCQKQESFNLVMIVIDAWRYDMLNASVMPQVKQFASNNWQFTKHYSGANATGPGIFTLFYGLPATYWPSAQTQKIAPVLMQELIKQNYQLGIFSSASMKVPSFGPTIFKDVHNLTLARNGADPYANDLAVTADFKNFITQLKSGPFFSFLFYDSAHGYCDFQNNFKPFSPAIAQCARATFNFSKDVPAYLNRYKNALVLVDQQVGEVLNLLRAKDLLKNTVVIITGDHGEEFNDSHMNYLGHASNFTPYQIQTPLIVHWPDSAAKIYTHQTSHFDIAPTLMHTLLHCDAKTSNYSVGSALLDTHHRDYLILGSYIDYGILADHEVLRLYTSGNYVLENSSAKPIWNKKFNSTLLNQALNDMRRFYY